MLSVPQDVEDHQVQTQPRRLDPGMDMDAFEDRCVASAESAYPGTSLSGSDAYVDCVGGFVSGTTTDETCADACDGKCCTGNSACGFIESDGTISFGFTGKGK